jgi:hypothetical protein
LVERRTKGMKEYYDAGGCGDVEERCRWLMLAETRGGWGVGKRGQEEEG